MTASTETTTLSVVMTSCGGHVDHLLAHVDEAHALDERDDQAQAGVDGLLVLAELLDEAPLVRAARS